MYVDLRTFLDDLRRDGDLAEIEAAVDPRLELAEVHRRVIAAGGPALLFRNPLGFEMPVVTNLFGTARRVERAFGRRPQQLVAEAARLPEELMPPSPGRLWGKRRLFWDLARVGFRRRRSAPVCEQVDGSPDLTRLPALTSWPDDGGPFLTLPLVHTRHPHDQTPNLGMYRVQIHDARHTGMHFQIGKGGGFHLGVAEAEQRPLPCQVYLGGPPALILSAIAPLPENVPELLLASLVLGRRLPLVEHPQAHFPLPATAELALVGELPPGERRPEGPFGDHYGYYSLEHDYPVLRVDRVLRRRDALFPATVVGKPRQEDFFIGDFLQELLSPLFPLVMPAVRDLWSYGETGYHALAAAVVRERYAREAMVSAFRILGEGQLALTKFLLLTDQPVDLRDFRATLEHVLARTRLETDLYVFSNLSMDTLDYTGPEVNKGSKGVWLGLGDPVRELPREYTKAPPAGVVRSRVFCGGCLVLEGGRWERDRDLAQRLTHDQTLADWPLVVLVDDAERTVASPVNFLWTTFTRFEPAADIHTASERIVRHHRLFSAPVVIDARLKPQLPEELLCDPETAQTVTRRWREYFPQGVEMGDSDRGHLS